MAFLRTTRTTLPPPLVKSPLPKPSGRDLVEDDPRWLEASYDTLQGRLEVQRRKPTRLRIPAWDEVARNLPPGLINNDVFIAAVQAPTGSRAPEPSGPVASPHDVVQFFLGEHGQAEVVRPGMNSWVI